MWPARSREEEEQSPLPCLSGLVRIFYKEPALLLQLGNSRMADTTVFLSRQIDVIRSENKVNCC